MLGAAALAAPLAAGPNFIGAFLGKNEKPIEDGEFVAISVFLIRGLQIRTDVNKAMQDGSTPLCIASLKGHSDVVTLLILSHDCVGNAETYPANENVKTIAKYA